MYYIANSLYGREINIIVPCLEQERCTGCFYFYFLSFVGSFFLNFWECYFPCQRMLISFQAKFPPAKFRVCCVTSYLGSIDLDKLHSKCISHSSWTSSICFFTSERCFVCRKWITVLRSFGNLFEQCLLPQQVILKEEDLVEFNHIKHEKKGQSTLFLMDR